MARCCLLMSLVALLACSADPALLEVALVAPAADVVALGTQEVAAAAGDILRVVSQAPRAEAGAVEAPLTHALVGGTESLPPLFVQAPGGIIPNPEVWGPLTATAWDGAAYWSTGAFLPGEQREIPLASALEPGVYRLRCALHPALAVAVAIGDPAVLPDSPPAVAVTGADVVAGVAADESFAYRFEPAELEIGVGDSVTWIAGGRAPVDVVFGGAAEELSLSHTDAADGLPAGDASAWDGTGELRSGFLSRDPSAGAHAPTFTVRFLAPGEYSYRSRFADTMSGVILVR